MYYHNITCPDMNNGDGLRVVLWLSGCSHHCTGCQNPQTWNENSGIVFDSAAQQELIDKLGLDYISGITLSGGDPLYVGNRVEVLKLCRIIRRTFGSTKTIWLYTGYAYEEIMRNKAMREIVQWCDILIDGEYKEELRDVGLHWRGSSNQRVIDVQATLAEGRLVLYEG